MRLRSIVLLSCVAACGKSSSTSSSGSAAGSAPIRSGAAADALWELAPDKLEGGFVVTPAALGVVDKVLDRVRALASDPELEMLTAPLAEIATALGGPQAHLADAGFATDKGFAFFQTEDGALIAVLPMGDRDKLVTTLKGQRSPNATDPDVVNRLLCKPVKAVYACAKELATLDRLGKGAMKGRTAAAGARGDVEMFLGPAIASRLNFDEVLVTAVIENGQVAFHGYAAGKPSGGLAALVTADKPKPGADNAAGFFVVNLAPILATIPDLELIPGASAAALAKSIKGPVTGTMAAGALEFHARVPLADPAPFTALLARCPELASVVPLAAQQPQGACRLAFPLAVPVELDLWVEGTELRLASHKGAPAKGKVDVMTPIATELASGGWSYAIWGRGSMVAPNGMTFPPLPGELPRQAALMIRALAQLSELGIGVKIGEDGIRVRGLVRTIWSNPSDMAQKLAAITADSIMKNTAAPIVKTIIDANPSAPFTADVAAGQLGLMAPVMAIGMLSSIAIPAFLDYGKQAKQSEAVVMLGRIGKLMKTAYLSDAKFPVGEAPLTPATSCCESRMPGMCEVAPANWTTPAWMAIDFALDEPHLFRYSYTSDGTTFTARAVGDLDCDGIEITHTLTGKLEHGEVVLELVEAPPTAD